MDESPSPTRRSKGESRTERLYKQAIAQQEKRKVLAAEGNRECTFAPKLVARDSRPTSASESRSKGDRFSRLYEQAKASKSRLDSARERPDADCTFKPELVAKRTGSTVRHGSVFDTLYKKAVDLNANLEERRKSAGLRGCTFAPSINPDRPSRASTGKSESKGDERPKTARAKLYDPEWVRRRYAPESNDPLNREVEECTFKPQLVAKPGTYERHSSEKHLKGRAVFEKLFSDASKIVAKRQEKAEQKAQSEFVECTFSPDLALTRDVLENHNMGAGSAHDRLYRQALDMKQKKSNRPDLTDMGCTFAPQISEASKELAKAMRRSVGADRFQEMYSEGLERQKMRMSLESNKSLEIVTKADVDNCTFKPAITPWPGMETHSKMPVHERLYANAFNRGPAMSADVDVDPMIAEEGLAAPAIDGSRRYVQGGDLYLI